MKEAPKARQGWLFKYPNPLESRLPAEFWASIPRKPGIYRMRDAEGRILYVGKAKNLRARLLSYRRARPQEVSRKVMRLVHLIRAIDWEECADETAALLRENQLLRELTPPFNRMNTRPETYRYIALSVKDGRATFRLTTDPKAPRERLFGAFKGRGSVDRKLCSLLRCLWACTNTGERFDLPLVLRGGSLQTPFEVALPHDWEAQLLKFLEGRDSGLLVAITDRLLENPSIPRFAYSMLQQDLETLQEFFNHTLLRHRQLRKDSGRRGKLIGQTEIDDLIVVHRRRRES
jgi:excinuclease UvrABC nuclease subunit